MNARTPFDRTAFVQAAFVQAAEHFLSGKWEVEVDDGRWRFETDAGGFFARPDRVSEAIAEQAHWSEINSNSEFSPARVSELRGEVSDFIARCAARPDD